MLVRWLVFLHVLSAITFFLAHSAAAAMGFKVRSETDFTRIRAMLRKSLSFLVIQGEPVRRIFSKPAMQPV
jgi:hypothetical protein